jgi:hypothetical protein
MGHGTRALANGISARRAEQGQRRVNITMFRGSSAVMYPDRKTPGTDVKNKDRLYNLKAQCWLTLRDRFEMTYRAVNGAKDYDPEQIISLSSDIKELTALCVELSIPAWRMSTSGRIIVEKYGEDESASSPNRADCVMMLMGAPVNRGLQIAPGTADRIDSGMSFVHRPVVSVDSGFSGGMITPMSSWPAPGQVWK